MKLLRDKACHSALARGNVKRLTVMGEVLMDGFSDRGSIPLISILDYHVKAIVARSRDTQHIPGIDWVCAFIFVKNKKDTVL